ncbi:ABC transporter [Sporanaerobium hydrogeniformans]|uniref:ABC transporter n=1 Tax=Sporanaerobium hydrogeniformans TaxID=3072179 RepID=A0AC61DDH4_9FIRM|nr:ABC transporter ATP-binding protein [Sporanaerobium hydrogeniformans]PHV70843.1 ABC transporter [Sporanaerobium hydrogeniformans]
MIKIQGLNYHVNDKPILEDICISFEKGKTYGIIGPNGAGKSTLLKHIMSLIKPPKHKIYYEGKDITDFKVKEYAKKVSFVFQENVREVDFSVHEILMMGRYTRMDLWGNIAQSDEEAIEAILEELHITALRNRKISTLSGGEAQKVFIGRALLQETPVLLLDEPTSMLDMHNGIEMMECIKGLKERHGLTVIMVIHDLNLAFYSCDELILLEGGKVVAKDASQSMTTSEILREVYQNKLKVIQEKGKNYIVPVMNY